MNNTLYITNRTGKPMSATISDNHTGNNVMCRELKPGTNEITYNKLDTGTYYISLTDHNDVLIYKEKIVKG